MDIVIIFNGKKHNYIFNDVPKKEVINIIKNKK
jgi:hypothetical protein